MFKVCPLELIRSPGKICLYLVKSSSFLTLVFSGKFSLLKSFPKLFFFSFQVLNFSSILILKFLKRVSCETLCLEFLDDLISVNNPSHFFQLSESLLVIVKFLSLVVFIMLVTTSIASRTSPTSIGFLSPRSWISTGWDLFINLILFFRDIFVPHLLDCDSSLLETFEFGKGSFLSMGSIMS